MTIKKRLFISNILMLVLPVVISICLISVLAYGAMSALGLWRQDTDKDDIYDVIDAIIQDNNEWRDLEEVTGFLDRHADYIESIGVSIALYDNGTQAYTSGSIPETSLAEYIAALEGSHYMLMDDISFYKVDIYGYTIIARGPSADKTSHFMQPETYRRMAFVLVVAVAVIIFVVFITNRLLTRMVIRSIINPLDTLVYGVRQIRDGHLEYRISYHGKDEFAGVCDDFNDMAQRLSDMVEARTRDDENRRELIAGISHDLRTPLTSIKAYVEGLQEGVASTPQLQKKYLDTIKGKTEDLEHIVSQLFLFSKIDIGDYSLSNELMDIGEELSAFVEGVADEYADKGLKITIEENTGGLIVNADSVQLRSVFTNLLENAAKYGAQPQGTMRVSCRAQKGRAVICWQDDGAGVPPEALERIFDVFYRGDKARGGSGNGSGLGLAISAKMMALMHGGIGAHNAPEGGLVVELWLPLDKSAKINGEEETGNTEGRA